MSPEFFNWSPFVALGLGLLAGLAALRSLNGALCLTVAAILAQALGWGIVFAFAGQNRDWNAPFLAEQADAIGPRNHTASLPGFSRVGLGRSDGGRCGRAAGAARRHAAPAPADGGRPRQPLQRGGEAHEFPGLRRFVPRRAFSH